MKKIYVILPVIVLIACVLYYFYIVGGSYRNEKFGYQISIPSGWHISEAMSKKMDINSYVMGLSNSIGCNVSELVEKNRSTGLVSTTEIIHDCIEKSPEFANIEQKHKNFEDTWTIDNAETIYITKMTDEEESKLTVTDLSMPGERLPKGSFVSIHPFDFVLEFAEATSSTKTGISRNYYYLEDKTKTYLTDFRDSKLTSSGLILSVPINSEVEIFNGEEGKPVKSISILTTAQKGSQEDSDFMSIIKSLKLTK